MLKPHLLALFVLLSIAPCLSQDPFGSPSQTTSGTGGTVDCTDPSQAGSAACVALQAQRAAAAGAGATGAGTATGGQVPQSYERTPVLRNLSPAQDLPTNIPQNPSDILRPKVPPIPQTEFEQLVADSVGRPLPLFGQSLFTLPGSTFSPLNLMAVPSDYIIGPGDELQIKIWGQVQADLRVIVDRAGQVYVPQVGQISVAGVHYGDLEQHLKTEISKNFKNFNLTANIGRLRSIQVVVVGNARYPGTYTISSLSTLVNAIFAARGPTPQGTLRHVQVRRDDKVITDFDFYDLLIHGDKSKDIHLQPGDVIFFPHVGPLVAISGSVNNPAIYEMKDESTLRDLIDSAGDLSTVADTSKITVERFSDHKARKTLEFPFDDRSRALPVQDGDIIRVFSIVPSFQDTVTLRGNVANPGRYPWKPGMRVRDIIPDVSALLTRRYWLDRASMVSGRSTEYPVRAERFQYNRCLALSQQTTPGNGNTGNLPGSANDATKLQQGPGLGVLSGDQSALGGVYDAMGSSNLPNFLDYCALYLQDQQDPYAAQYPGSERREFAAGRPGVSGAYVDSTVNPNTVRNVTEDLRRFAPEINWDYAIIQRVNPEDLSSKLVWISPRKILLDHEDTSNLELQPGDIITIFSQRDISVPQTERSRYVIVEGEVRRPGVYKLELNEGLHSVLQRAGGLTPSAYVYGSQLTRESARIEQQRSLDELVRNMEVEVRQVAMKIPDAGQAALLQAAQEGIIAQLRSTRASGRVALPVRPSSKDVSDFPNMVLEDSDRLTVPHTPSTVSVVGNVYNPGSFIFEPRTSAGTYLEMAGKGKPQSDLRHAFILRASGVVVAANNVNGVLAGKKFNRLRLYPGDQIVVPYKLASGLWMRNLRDWTQISSQLAITGAAIAVLR